MANFDSEFFGLVFPGVQARPKNSRPKFTSRIVGSPLQFHFLEPKIYSRRFSAYVGDQQNQYMQDKIIGELIIAWRSFNSNTGHDHFGTFVINLNLCHQTPPEGWTKMSE